MSSARHQRITITPLLGFLGLIILIVASPALAARRERLIDSWKPLHYNVSLTLNDRLTEITKARTEITIQSLKNSITQIDLDFGELNVDSVMVNNEQVSFESAKGLLIVKLRQPAPTNTRLQLTVIYHGRPSDGLILTVDKAGKPSAIGDNWPDRLHHWIPCLDHPSAKATINFTVTAPARDLVVANGKLERIENTSDSTRTWIYNESAPIPPYCMIVAVGEFEKVEPSEQAITPLAYYVPTPDKPFAMQGFAAANPSLKFFSETIAPYPYEKLALIVGATRFGGMENSTAILFSNNVFNPSRSDSQPYSRSFNLRESLVSLVAHEIAHQWFGDSVTESTWADLWLSEGFATYFAGLLIRKYDGDAAFQEYMRNQAETYFQYAKNNRAPIHDTSTENLFQLLNANNYQKGAWVLHMLRAELGDEVFYRGLRAYYNSYKNSIASSEDLRLALEKASGRDLKAFFASWIYGAGHPRYKLSWEWKEKGKKLRLVLKQLQPEAAFLNRVEVDIQTASGARSITITPKSKQTIEEIKLNGAPQHILLDPHDDILDENSSVDER